MQFMIIMKLHYTSEQWYIAWDVGLRLMGGVCRLGWKFQSITRHHNIVIVLITLNYVYIYIYI